MHPGINDLVFSALPQVVVEVENDGRSWVLKQKPLRASVTQMLPGVDWHWNVLVVMHTPGDRRHRKRTLRGKRDGKS